METPTNNNKNNGNNSVRKSWTVIPFLAGGIAGINEILLTYPLEYLKTTLQLQQHFQPSSQNVKLKSSASFQTLPTLLKYTYEQKGIIGFYQGLSPWLLFAFPRSAIRFSTFETVKSLFLENNTIFGGTEENYNSNNEKASSKSDQTNLTSKPKAKPENNNGLSPVQAMIAGSLAGTMEWGLVGTTMQCLQIRMSHDAYTKKRFQGKLGKAISIIVREDGVWKGLYAGIGPTVLKGLVNNCIRFATMQELKNYYESYYRSMSVTEKPFTMTETMAMGCLSGGISAFCTHPIDTVKSNVQLLGEKGAGSAFQCLKYLVKNKGILFLYKGFGPRFIRVSLEIGLHFTLYDQYCELLRGAYL